MNPEELWQVDSGGQVYEASFEVLTQWVIEGTVLPTDKIRRGNLRWLDAGKVPVLQRVFNSRSAGEQPQIQTTFAELAPTVDNPIHTFANEVPIVQSPEETAPEQHFDSTTEPVHILAPRANPTQPTASAIENECANHNGAEAKFVCTSCEKKFCRDCPNTYGTVNVCPGCGELCELIVKVAQNNKERMQYHSAISDGFGFGDFTNALAFPFKHPTSLIIGGVMFAFFSIGQAALGMGSIYLVVGAIFSMMLSNMLAFACLSNTINEFSNGNLTTNFMPAFDDFNIWDDVLHPFILSIGVYIVSFGLLIVVIAGGIYFAFSAIPKQPDQLSGLTALSPQSAPGNAPAMNSFDELKRKDMEQKAKIAELMNSTGSPQTSAKTQLPVKPIEPQDTEKSVAMAEKTISDLRKGQAEALLGPSPETKAAQNQEMLANILKYGVVFFALAIIGALWAFFYFPAACLVAGYTRSFTAVINPLIGLDTIKRLGFNYVKILGMQIILSVVLAIFVGILGAILSPFNLPTIGNIPVTLISSFAYFYYYIVFAAILGYAVYKTKDLLDISANQ